MPLEASLILVVLGVAFAIIVLTPVAWIFLHLMGYRWKGR